jgi:hypothetical protein
VIEIGNTKLGGKGNNNIYSQTKILTFMLLIVVNVNIKNTPEVGG